MKISACRSCEFWSLSLLIGGGLLLAAGIILPVWIQRQEFIGSENYWICFHYWYGGLCRSLTFLGGACLLSSLFAMVFKKTVETNCRLSSSLSAFFVSVTSSAGFYCLFVWCVLTAFGEIRLHPLEYIGSISGGSVCLIACILLIGYYYQQRKKHFSLRGIVLDVTLMVLFFIPMLSVWNCVHFFLENLI